MTASPRVRTYGSIAANRREGPQVDMGRAALRLLRAARPRLVDSLEVRQLPGLVEEGLRRTIKAEPDPPTLRRTGIHPVALLTRRRFRAEVEVGGAVCVLLDLVE